ncbi:Mlp1p KNAG_0C06590 [Huiozyma naganishii CBS 8797]|uniref:NUA/TPR/MLP1-2-like domain-containing protein n=1 Tax=Huiozyma naganishii (strain ATCC MYA-139 / BCRC 22969 / CBS 8797 / KCTC 17520 / NBRC 10181 / NCYC 3082 / Yp74L-3) TaxID=1071383 RepID=J7RXE6_HUIN7|nr:hypothetical protein KNAG_0C06590 [Kazachstania naganishii CBS 8797]CCK69752.1 hypothetical protein KNAG_0C06590 [Kazachstania naganishii CBS 8797]
MSSGETAGELCSLLGLPMDTVNGLPLAVQNAIASKFTSERQTVRTVEGRMELIVEENRLLKSSNLDMSRIVTERAEEIGRLRDEVSTVTGQTSALRAELENLQNDLELLKDKDLALQSERDSTVALLDGLKLENSALRAEIEQAKELASIRQHDYEADLDSKTGALVSKEEELRLAKSERASLISQTERLSQELLQRDADIRQLVDADKLRQDEYTDEINLQKHRARLLQEQVASLEKEAKLVGHETEPEYEIPPPGEEVALQQRSHSISMDSLLTGNDETSHSMSELNNNISILSNRLKRETLSKQKLEKQVHKFVTELEQTAPIIKSFKQKSEQSDAQIHKLQLHLEHVTKDKETIFQEVEQYKKQLEQISGQDKILRRERFDLARQLQYLLLNGFVKDSDDPLTSSEFSYIKEILNTDPEEGNTSSTDSQLIISKRMLKFKSIVELQQQNINLLSAVRTLSDRAETLERKLESGDSIEAINEAKQTLLDLQQYNSSLEAKVESLTNKLKANEHFTSIGDGEFGNSDLSDGNNIQALKNKYDSLMAESSETIGHLYSQINNLQQSKSDLAKECESLINSKHLIEDRLKITQDMLDLSKNENSTLRNRIKNTSQALKEREVETSQTIKKYLDCVAKLDVIQRQLENTLVEKDILQNAQSSIENKLNQALKERNNFQGLIPQLRALQKNQDEQLKDIQVSLQNKIDDLELENTELRNKIDTKETSPSSALTNPKAELEWYQTKFDSLSGSNDALNEKMIECASTIETLTVKTQTLDILLQEANSKNKLLEARETVDDVNKLTGALETELATSRTRLTDTSRELEISSNTIRQYQSEIKVLNERQSELENENKHLRDEIAILRDELTHNGGEFEREKEALMKKLSNLEIRQAELTKLEEDYTAEIEKLKLDLDKQAMLGKEIKLAHDEEVREVQNRNTETYRNELELVEIRQTKVFVEKEKELESRIKILNEQIELDKERMKQFSDEESLLREQVKLLADEKASDLVDAGVSPEYTDLVRKLSDEKKNLESKLFASQSEKNRLREQLTKTESEIAVLNMNYEQAKKEVAAEVNNESGRAEEHIAQLESLKESNMSLTNEVKLAQMRNGEIIAELNELKTKFKSVESQLDEARNVLSSKDMKLMELQTECSRLKATSHDMPQNGNKDSSSELVGALQSSVATLTEQVDNLKHANTELEDRFGRLKRQARERLDASKVTINSLRDNVETLTKDKTALQDVIERSKDELNELRAKIQEHIETSAVMKELKTELAAVMSKNKDIEAELNETSKSSNQLTTALNEEIESLKHEVQYLKEASSAEPQGNEEMSGVVESMRKAFEDEKIAFMKATSEDSEARLAEERGKLKREMEALEKEKDSLVMEKTRLGEENTALMKARSDVPDIETLQKQWEASNKERLVLLYKEKSDQMMRAKMDELEEQFQNRVRNKEKELNALKDEIEEKCKTGHEDTLIAVKKRAFEEGKQQATMKMSILERKIAKLEAESKATKSGSDMSVSEDAPRFVTPNNNKVQQANQPFLATAGSGFSVQSSESNPFTTPVSRGAAHTNASSQSKFAPTFLLNSQPPVLVSGSSDEDNDTMRGTSVDEDAGTAVPSLNENNKRPGEGESNLKSPSKKTRSVSEESSGDSTGDISDE